MVAVQCAGDSFCVWAGFYGPVDTAGKIRLAAEIHVNGAYEQMWSFRHTSAVLETSQKQ